MSHMHYFESKFEEKIIKIPKKVNVKPEGY